MILSDAPNEAILRSHAALAWDEILTLDLQAIVSTCDTALLMAARQGRFTPCVRKFKDAVLFASLTPKPNRETPTDPDVA